jgi:hypothetical protein
MTDMLNADLMKEGCERHFFSLKRIASRTLLKKELLEVPGEFFCFFLKSAWKRH